MFDTRTDIYNIDNNNKYLASQINNQKHISDSQKSINLVNSRQTILLRYRHYGTNKHKRGNSVYKSTHLCNVMSCSEIFNFIKTNQNL